MSWRNRFGAAAFALALLGCAKTAPAPAPQAPPPPSTSSTAPTSGPVKPALWRIGHQETTIYLFGTVHVLPPELAWKTKAIDAALGAAKAVYFETDVNPNPVALMPMVTRLGVYTPPDKLSDHLKPDERAAVANAGAKLSITMNQVDTMKPWLAAMTLSEETIAKSGYDPNSGVERTLLPIATAAGKDIRKLETVEQQLLVFADLPEPVQINYLLAGLKEIDNEPNLLADLVKAWSGGDTAALEKLMIEDDLEETPEVYQALLVKRNRNWAEILDHVAKEEPGVFFVAVGAGHLTGKDSLLTMLAAKGYKVDRIE